ncbi:NAD(+) diphosphatase [Treponema sp.]|uniref:NAD(+) diphosphatase n=1 Tax=Treponema sp. TaxID=166 RepID=UPI003F0D8E09
MPVVTRPAVLEASVFFVFLENEILVKNNCPISKNEFLYFASDDFSDDWYTETNLFYAAALAKKNAVLPEGCAFIPVRQFCFEHRELSFLASRAASLLKQRKIFVFCPSCGNRLDDDKKESAKRCPGCGSVFFPRIEPATITLVSRQDEILLVKNRNSSYKNFACVSGFVEQGESLEACVAREIMEETGIRVKNIRYRGSQAWPFPDQLMFAFTADYESGELKIQEEEILEARWFKRTELPPETELPRPGSVAWNLINGVFQNTDR